MSIKKKIFRQGMFSVSERYSGATMEWLLCCLKDIASEEING